MIHIHDFVIFMTKQRNSMSHTYKTIQKTLYKPYIVAGVLMFLMSSAAASSTNKAKKPDHSDPKFHLSSSFPDGQPIPPIHAYKPTNQAPTLKWSHVPEGTQSFVLIMHDPDARPPFTHWLVANIPADLTELSDDLGEKRTLPNGIVQGKNDFGKIGYGGPYPPPGAPHRYYFELTALNVSKLKLPKDFTAKDLEAAMKGHKLGSAQLMGTFARSAAPSKRR